MKKVFLIVVFFVFLGFSVAAHAALIDSGYDTNGYHLIYDTDLNITWCDYKFANTTWDSAMSFAQTVVIGGVTGWRLPVAGAETTTTYGDTTSEMGHLYYTELGNSTSYANLGLTNLGLFSSNTLTAATYYWMGTESTSGRAYEFGIGNGWTGSASKGTNYPFLLVYDGLVGSAAVPIPAASFLFAPGLAGLIAIRRKFRK